MKTMKQLFKATLALTAVTISIFTLSSFKKKAAPSAATAYSINLVSNPVEASKQQQWTWVLTNTNPGNGSNGTLQDVSHFDISLSQVAEAALLSTEYSFDGINWISGSIIVDRDPAIRACTNNDVLKFDAGTVGSQPTYYRATFSQTFSVSPYSTSWIKSGVKTGCNMYYFTGIGGTKLD